MEIEKEKKRFYSAEAILHGVLRGPPGVVILLRSRGVEHAELDEFAVHGAAGVSAGLGVFTVAAGADPPVARSKSRFSEGLDDGLGSLSGRLGGGFLGAGLGAGLFGRRGSWRANGSRGRLRLCRYRLLLCFRQVLVSRQSFAAADSVDESPAVPPAGKRESANDNRYTKDTEY